jgi:hypothetical protein
VATRLQQILPTGNVNPGAQVVLNHNLNVGPESTPVLADEVAFDNANFDYVTMTTTTITVINRGPGVASSNVRITHFHTINREFGARQTTDLTPQPFVIRGGSSSGSPASSLQSFRYTATGAEGSDFMVPLPAARGNDTYSVQAQCAGVTSILGIDCPDLLAGDRTTTQFRVITTGAVTAGDQFDFIVTDR